MVRTSIKSDMPKQFGFGQVKTRASPRQHKSRQGQGRARAKCNTKQGQVEPTRDTLELDPSKGTVQAYVQERDANKASRSQDPRPIPHCGKI